MRGNAIYNMCTVLSVLLINETGSYILLRLCNHAPAWKMSVFFLFQRHLKTTEPLNSSDIVAEGSPTRIPFPALLATSL